MFESIGEAVKTGLSLEWIERLGGFVELVSVKNGEERALFPGCKEYSGTTWNGGYLNMSPGPETSLAFVDSQNDITVERTTGMYRILLIRFRVVVWYDENAIEYEGDKTGRMVQDVIDKVKAVEFVGLKSVRTIFEGLSVDPNRIWGQYNYKPDDALFMAPYRTFAVSFRMRAYQMTKICGEALQTNEVCC